MSLEPGDVTARSEHSGMKNAGEMGSECQICARPVGVRFFYDDPLNTPITDLEVKLADMSGGTLVEALTTEAPVSRGLQDATSGVGAMKAELGGVTHGEIPFAAGAATATTNSTQDIPSRAEEAWQIEQDIVSSLEQFENSMKVKFQPYVDEWQRDGAIGAIGDYYKGVGKGVVSWWDGEKDFWGTAWGALKGSAAAVGNYIGEANAEGLPTWIPGAVAANVLWKAGGDIVGLFDGAEILDFLDTLGKLMRAFLAGDIDGIIREFENLTGLEDLPGAIGEFGLMIKEAVADGVDWMRDMIEVLRRTPVLNLMVNTAMRCILLMTPNFWAKVLGEGVGFIIPELLIWIVTTLIAGLSAGAGATVLAVRCAGIASKIRKAIKGSTHVTKILSFLDELKPIFDKIGDLGKKLRQSIEEAATGIMNGSHRVVRSSRYWRTRLDDLAKDVAGAHGPQRHEGDVTDKELLDRILRGIDPMSKTTVDAVTGKKHIQVRHATKINTPADYVRAYDHITEKLTDKLYDEARLARYGGESRFAIQFSIADIFETGVNVRLKGYSRVGPKSSTQFQPIDFEGGYIKAVFKFKDDGTFGLYTMFPNAKTL